jgi:lipoate-protein ligase A
VAVLAKFGLAAQLVECTSQSPDPAATTGCGTRSQDNESFLCFVRRTPGDVLLDGWKIAGSAQRRHRGAVLQHGSILFERSPVAPELPGIHDLTSIRLDRRGFASQLQIDLSRRLGIGFTHQPLSADLSPEAAAIEASKFATEDWLHLR